MATTNKLKTPPKIFTAAQNARQIIRSSQKAFLNTITNAIEPDIAGWPASSMVTVATAWNGSPILMLSDIAHHTQNIQADNRCTLMYDGTAGYKNPQEGPRVSVIGHLKKTKNKQIPERFLSRHPNARHYAGFGDFNFYKLRVEKIHFVGGFARAIWINKNKSTLPKSSWSEIAEAERGIISHMNGDHHEALRLYGNEILKKKGKHWRMISIDPEGFDLKCGDKIHRLNFDEPSTTSDKYRESLVKLAANAGKRKN